LIGTHHCAMDGRVESGCVTACREDSNAFHLCTVKGNARFFQHGVNCNDQFTIVVSREELVPDALPFTEPANDLAVHYAE
jgi:hypothetical protein